MYQLRLRRTLVVAAALSLGLAACGSDDSSISSNGTTAAAPSDTTASSDAPSDSAAVTTGADDTPDTAEVEDLGSINVGMVCGGMTPAIAQIAINTESFAPSGVDVKKLCFDGGSEGVQALLGGSIDVFLGSLDHIASTRREGLDTRGYAVINNEFPYWMLTQTNSPYESVADLSGQVVGVTSPGSLSETGLRASTDEADIAFDELTVIGAGSGATMRAALDANQIAAGMVSQPGIAELTQSGEYRVLWQPEFSYVSIVAIASEGWVADHETQMKAFLGVLQDTAVHAEEDLAWAVEAMATEGFKVEDAALEEAVKETLAGVPSGLAVTADDVAKTSEILISVEKLDEPLAFDEGFDFSYLSD